MSGLTLMMSRMHLIHCARRVLPVACAQFVNIVLSLKNTQYPTIDNATASRPTPLLPVFSHEYRLRITRSA